MGIYSEIKEQVSTRAVAEHYGYKVSRNGMMCCPFHDDRTPSMKVDQNFICFGCQEKGDVITFATKLFDMSPYEAAGKLATDMGLSVGLSARPDAKPGARKRARRKRQEAERFADAVNRIYSVYCEYFHLLSQWAVDYAPEKPDEKLHPLFVEAMHKRGYVGYLLDLLLYGSKEEKAQVVIEKGKEVGVLENRIREFKTGDRKRAACGGLRGSSGDDRGCGQGDAGSDGERIGQKHDIKRRADHVL